MQLSCFNETTWVCGCGVWKEKEESVRIALEPAFVLHTRAFNETSTILDVFTVSHGRVSLVAKGARSQRSRYRGLLRPFIPLLLSWSGKSELMTLTGAECRTMPIILTGMGLLSGMYLNELLIRLLPKLDDHPELFLAYEQTLSLLMCDQHREKTLRSFEKNLLKEMGYALSFERDATEAEDPIIDQQKYILLLGRGFVPNTFHEEDYPEFEGKCLLDIGVDKLEDKDTLYTAKRLMRLAIGHLLENRPLKTRVFFQGSTSLQ